MTKLRVDIDTLDLSSFVTICVFCMILVMMLLLFLEMAQMTLGEFLMMIRSQPISLDLMLTRFVTGF